MRRTDDGAGVKLGRSRTRRSWALTGVALIMGAGLELYLRPYLHHAPGGRPQLPASVAVITVSLCMLMLTVALWLGLRWADEFERRNFYIAGFGAFVVNLSASLLWVCLRAANIVGERGAIFALNASAAAFVGIFAWLQIRDRFAS